MYGEFIAKHRVLSGYKSQRQLAEKSGISSATISRIEAEVQKPLPETLRELAKYLHTTSLVELMVICGYWDENELLDPDSIKESPSPYVTNTDGETEKELSSLSIEDLIEKLKNEDLTYYDHRLTEEQKKIFLSIIQNAADAFRK